MTDTLRVWLATEPVGVLERADDDVIRFLPDHDASGMSVAAPPSAQAWSPDLTLAWFDGLLPEGRRRDRVEARLGLRPGDSFGLLAEIGWECAGAVSVLPVGRVPSTGHTIPATTEEVAARLDALPDLSIEPENELRMSLGGEQDKILLAGAPGSWAFPADGALSTFIVKPEPDRWPGLAIAEAWALAASRAVTDAAEAFVDTDLGRRPALVVRRFDRIVGGTSIDRVHQEDLCQALGLPPSRKYARPNTPRGLAPSWAGLARILRIYAESPDEELVALLRHAVISVALRNTDMHGKNLSILHERGVVRMAPVYDVATTTVFIPAQQHIGLSVDGVFRIDHIATEQLLSEAKSWGMPERVATAVIASAASALGEALQSAGDWQGLPAGVRSTAEAGVFSVGLPQPGRAPSRDRARELGRATLKPHVPKS